MSSNSNYISPFYKNKVEGGGYKLMTIGCSVVTF